MSDHNDFSGIDMRCADPIVYPDPEPLTEEILLEGIARAEEREEWLRRNPLGSEKNPWIVSPALYKSLKALGLFP